MKNSLQKIMNGLIDYAGLFPPAKLPLDEAINEYVSHVSDEKEWMLGRFIIPLSKLNDLEKHIPKFSKIGTIRLSVLGGQSTSDKEFLEQTKNEISLAIGDLIYKRSHLFAEFLMNSGHLGNLKMLNGTL